MKYLPLRVIALTVIVLIAFVGTPTPTPGRAANRIPISWYIGLGTGTSDDQILVEKKVAQDFNASQDRIELKLWFRNACDDPYTACLTTILPDIVGPVTIGGAPFLASRWLDLKPTIERQNYDLSVFKPALLAIHKTPGGGYDSLPFAVYPTVLYYNPTLFDRAGLHYPPQKFDEPYLMPDGSSVEWNYDTLATLASLLTLDENGNNATSSQFDPEHIVQYGVNFQWAAMRLILTDLQPIQLYDAASKRVAIPNAWRKAAQWVWNGLWKEHFIPTTAAETGPLLNGDFNNFGAFNSGHLAMALTPLWYTCCLYLRPDNKPNLDWNIAVVPRSFDGQYHVATDADTFYILNTTQHFDEAFVVYTYLLDKAVPELSQTYRSFPARSEYQQAWFDRQNTIFTQGVNWQVVKDSLNYANPAALDHETQLPNDNQVRDRFLDFYTALFGENGAKANVNTMFDTLQGILQNIVLTPTPTPFPTATFTPAPVE